MQRLSNYSTRLVEERRKMMNNSDFQPFQVCHFKIVTSLHLAITTADWGRLYKLLYM